MELFDYQKKAANTAYSYGDHILLCECGTGKTVIELSIIRHRLRVGEIKNCLIVAPLSILWTSWESDINKFYPELLRSILWAKTPAARKKLIESFSGQIAIINYEALHAYAGSLPKFDMVVLDESTRIRGHASKLFKTCMRLASEAKYRSIMTATPGHIPEHYWSQLTFVGTLSLKFSTFQQHFCYPIPLGETGLVKWKPKSETMPELKAIISSRAVRLTKAECLSLPDKSFIVREIHIPPAGMDIYKTMRDDSVVTYEGDVVMAQYPGVLSNKLRQLASGVLYSHETGKRYRVHDAKLKELDEIMDSTDEQVIVWANYQEDVEELARRYDALTYYGRTYDKMAVHNEFVSGKKKVIICHPASAAHGITWVNCHIQVFYSLPHLELFLQAQDRVHRIGQKNPCVYYILNAVKTVDEIAWKALQQNRDFQEDLITFTTSLQKEHGIIPYDYTSKGPEEVD